MSQFSNAGSMLYNQFLSTPHVDLIDHIWLCRSCTSHPYPSTWDAVPKQLPRAPLFRLQCEYPIWAYSSLLEENWLCEGSDPVEIEYWGRVVFSTPHRRTMLSSHPLHHWRSNGLPPTLLTPLCPHQQFPLDLYLGKKDKTGRQLISSSCFHNSNYWWNSPFSLLCWCRQRYLAMAFSGGSK